MGQASPEAALPLQAFQGLAPRRKAKLEGVRVIGPEYRDQFIQQEQRDAGFEGHWSDVTARSVPRF